MVENTIITLNIQQPNISTVVYAVQNDRLSRHVIARLLDGSAFWTPPPGAGAFIRYLKPDGTAGFYDTDENGSGAITISDSTATLTIAEQALTVPGDVYMQLNFYGTDGSKLTTFCWILRVQKSVLEDATIVSSDYFNVLSAQISAVLNAAASLTGMTATASGLPTGSSPTVEVTGGSDGTPYNLAFGIPAGAVGPANIPTSVVNYQASTSATTAPTGTWTSSPPAVAPGAYLWTRVVVTFSGGGSSTYYAVARQGVDGSGSPGTQNPLADTMTGEVGTSTSFSREDHRHPLPFDLIYPVGYVYISVIAVNPAALFGGTWEQIKDVFLLATGDTYAAGTTGGEAEHTLTTDEMPEHNHGLGLEGSGSVYAHAVNWLPSSTGSETTGAQGGGQAHNNMPPYLVVYVWKRTA